MGYRMSANSMRFYSAVWNSLIVEGRVCSYGAAQSDRYLLYADRMVSGSNEGTCRLACDSERHFRCRSYSWHLHSSLACSLSSSTSSASNSYQVNPHPSHTRNSNTSYFFKTVPTRGFIQRKRLFSTVGERRITVARNGSTGSQSKSWEQPLRPATQHGRFGRLGQPQRSINPSSLDRKSRKQSPTRNATVRKFTPTADNKSPTDGYCHPAHRCNPLQPRLPIL